MSVLNIMEDIGVNVYKPKWKEVVGDYCEMQQGGVE